MLANRGGLQRTDFLAHLARWRRANMCECRRML